MCDGVMCKHQWECVCLCVDSSFLTTTNSRRQAVQKGKAKKA